MDLAGVHRAVIASSWGGLSRGAKAFVFFVLDEPDHGASAPAESSARGRQDQVRVRTGKGKVR